MLEKKDIYDTIESSYIERDERKNIIWEEHSKQKIQSILK